MHVNPSLESQLIKASIGQWLAGLSRCSSHVLSWNEQCCFREVLSWVNSSSCAGRPGLGTSSRFARAGVCLGWTRQQHCQAEGCAEEGATAGAEGRAGGQHTCEPRAARARALPLHRSLPVLECQAGGSGQSLVQAFPPSLPDHAVHQHASKNMKSQKGLRSIPIGSSCSTLWAGVELIVGFDCQLLSACFRQRIDQGRQVLQYRARWCALAS